MSFPLEMNQPVAPSSPPSSDALDALRRDIDALDQQIVELLARRAAKVQEVVTLKKAAHLPVYHAAREENLISQRRDQAARVGLDPDFVEELYRGIMRQSRMRQNPTVWHCPTATSSYRSTIRPGKLSPSPCTTR